MGGNAPSCPYKGEQFLICAVGGTTWQDVENKLINPYIWPDYRQAYGDFLKQCTETAVDPGVGLACFNDFALLSQYGNTGMVYELNTNSPNFAQLVPYSSASIPGTQMILNGMLIRFYQETRYRIVQACGEELFPDVWPLFYHFYNTENGKRSVDEFLRTHTVPTACANLLKQNYLPKINAEYGLINMPDIWTSNYFYDVIGSLSGGSQLYPGCIGRYLINTLGGSDKGWVNKSIFETPYSLNYWGNPFWSTKERNLAFAKVVGKDYKTNEDFYTQWAKAYVKKGLDQAGKVASDYWNPEQHPGDINVTTNPKYVGNLPLRVTYPIGQEPYHRITRDPQGYEYKNPCLEKTTLESLMPPVCGLVAGALAAAIIPGSFSRLIAGLTAGSSAYLIAENVFGMRGTMAWFGSAGTTMELPATVLSVGFPAAIFQALYDIGVMPDNFQNLFVHAAGFFIVGATGYMFLQPLVSGALQAGGWLFVMLSLPIATLEWGVTMLFNGCANHAVKFYLTCDCEAANNKPLMAEALVEDIYGCTEKQKDLRLEAMHAAMVNGPMGTDPIALGTCDGYGHMSNPLACLSAGELAYQKWPSEIAVGAQAWWDSIKHVVDKANPSFLPPLEKDSQCRTQYGEYFRNDGSGGCKDYRAPVGMQGPGQFDWSTVQPNYVSEETCTLL